MRSISRRTGWTRVAVLVTGWAIGASLAHAQTGPTQRPQRAPAAQGPVQQGPVQQGSAVQGPAQGPVQGPAAPAVQQPGAPRVAAVPNPQVAEMLRQPFPPLNPQAQDALNRLLTDWEAASSKIKTLDCTFTLFEYDMVFNPEKPKIYKGDLKYENPDKGLYRYQNIDADGNPVGEYLEHWICDGKSIFEFNATKQQLIERPLPPELQGQGITNGPLPFLFNSKAETLKKRYWLRLVPPPQQHPDMVMLEAYPKFREDAANFRAAQLLLYIDGLRPYAVNLDLPNGKDRNVHIFADTTINDPLRVIKRSFDVPRLPAGWTRVVDNGQQIPQEANRAPAPAGPAQPPIRQ